MPRSTPKPLISQACPSPLLITSIPATESGEVDCPKNLRILLANSETLKCGLAYRLFEGT